jgi:hypothetical protein
MTVTSTQPTISNQLGELFVSDDVWSATLTKEGSDAISAIDWNGEYLEVTFRRGSNNSDPYVYTAKTSAVEAILNAVRAVLSGASTIVGDATATASVGSVYNQMLKSNQLVLVN